MPPALIGVQCNHFENDEKIATKVMIEMDSCARCINLSWFSLPNRLYKQFI